MNRLYALAFCVCSILAVQTKGQDQQYTQFYSNPMLLNPAFAGTSVQTRVAMNYRNQWPALPQSFVSYSVGVDHFVPTFNSGMGITVNHDKAGVGGLTYTSASFHYAYEIRVTRKISIRPGISFGFGSNYLDVNKLTFMDQLARDDDGATTLDPDRTRFEQEPVNYPDFAGGLVFYSEKIWLGAALHHMNEPIQSLTGGESRLPKRFTMHGGVRVKLSETGAFSKRQYIVPAFNYQAQGLFDQLDLGFYYEYAPLMVGVWYRGLPIKSNDYDYANHDAIAFLVGYEYNNMTFGYSYDLTVSELTPNSAGSHEISLVMEFATKRNKKKSKRRIMPCAKF